MEGIVSFIALVIMRYNEQEGKKRKLFHFRRKVILDIWVT